MQLEVFLIPLLLITQVITEDLIIDEETDEEKEERVNAEWDFVLYELIDNYDDYSTSRRKFLNGKITNKEMVKTELKYLGYLRNQSLEMRSKEVYDTPSAYQNMHEFLLKPNVAMLEENDLRKFIEFRNSVEQKLKNATILDPNDEETLIDQKGYEEKLASVRNLTYLEEIWGRWHSNFNDFNFEEILLLNEKIASLNDNYDFIKQWEDYVQYTDGYEDMKSIWEEIEPLYKQLHRFVLDRLNNYYKSNFTNIPVYLTGSKFGEDWSNLADIVVPHQQIYQDAVTSLSEMSKKTMFEHCSQVANMLKFKPNSDLFWKTSQFNTDYCPGEIISFSSEKYSTLLTCNKSSWIEYLNTQEIAYELGLKNLDYTSLPYREIKSSFLHEGIKSLGSTVAVHNLPYDEFIEKDAFSTHLNATDNLLIARLLVALRVLPKLAYFYAVDTWRINEMQSPSGDLINSWWSERIKTQGVEGVTLNETDFLQDFAIINNQPYLGKFLGTVLQFNFLSSIDYTSPESIINQLVDGDLPSAVNDIPQKTPRDLIGWHLSIEQITYYDIKLYFEYLPEYFDRAPLQPVPFLRRKLKQNKIETTTASEFESTPKENISLGRKTEVSVEVKPPEGEAEKKPKTSSLGHGMYILITIGACALIMIGLIVFKRLVKRKKRTNNRRFQA